MKNKKRLKYYTDKEIDKFLKDYQCPECSGKLPVVKTDDKSGWHKRYRCNECGLVYDYVYPDWGSSLYGELTRKL